MIVTLSLHKVVKYNSSNFEYCKTWIENESKCRVDHFLSNSTNCNSVISGSLFL